MPIDIRPNDTGLDQAMPYAMNAMTQTPLINALRMGTAMPAAYTGALQRNAYAQLAQGNPLPPGTPVNSPMDAFVIGQIQRLGSADKPMDPDTWTSIAKSNPTLGLDPDSPKSPRDLALMMQSKKIDAMQSQIDQKNSLNAPKANLMGAQANLANAKAQQALQPKAPSGVKPSQQMSDLSKALQAIDSAQAARDKLGYAQTTIGALPGAVVNKVSSMIEGTDANDYKDSTLPVAAALAKGLAGRSSWPEIQAIQTTLGSLGGTKEFNDRQFDRMRQIVKAGLQQQQTQSAMPSATPTAGKILMLAPDGQTRGNVPFQEVPRLLKSGYSVVKQ